MLAPIWLPKLAKMEPKFDRKSSTGFERHFGSSGGLLGQFGGRFGGHFGVLFWPPARKPDFVRIVLPPTREHDFHGSGGSEKRQKRVWKQCAAGGVLQDRLGRLLGSIFEHSGSILGPKIGPKACQKASFF